MSSDIHQRAIKIKILMMQKNEDLLLPIWIKYHGSLFGYKNLYVFDNGSTNRSIQEYLLECEELGVNILYNFNTKSDFENKGPIIAEAIQRLDREDPAEFYFPVDCDDFIAVRPEKTVAFDIDSIQRELACHKGTEEVLAIDSGYDNLPGNRTQYVHRTDRVKTFFGKDTCLHLDLGFHGGISKAGSTRRRTKIVYFHLHNRAFLDLQERAKEKMIGRVKNFQTQTLLDHKARQLNGTHLVDELLLNSNHDYINFLNNKYSRFTKVEIPEFPEALKSSGTNYPY